MLHHYNNMASFSATSGSAEMSSTDVKPRHLTEGDQSKHLVELPLLGVPDEVGGVGALLGAMVRRPPEVRLAKQAEHTQLPVDLRKGTRQSPKSFQRSEALCSAHLSSMVKARLIIRLSSNQAPC